jgi:uncharacterized protein YkwD/LysM repeat protein
MRTPLLILCLVLSGVASHAQCPSINQPGVHVVQKGETLSSISRMYGISIARLCSDNGLNSKSVLPHCRVLKVSDAVSTTTPTATYGEYVNTAPATYSTTAPASNSTYVKPYELYGKQLGDRHIVDEGETIENIARLYGYTTERFCQFNNIPTSRQVPAGTALRSTHCPPCPTIGADGQTIIRSSVREVPVMEKAATLVAHSATSSYDAAEPVRSIGYDNTYMGDDERAMLAEINVLRSNPRGYIPMVASYIAALQRNDAQAPTIRAAYELIEDLRRTPALSTLSPTQCLYVAAVRHANDQRLTGDMNHQGRDGLWPWDRVRNECTLMNDGGENIIGGTTDIREAILLLLIDAQVPDRGHRRTLLNPSWNFAICHYVGQVGNVASCWIQQFGN